MIFLFTMLPLAAVINEAHAKEVSAIADNTIAKIQGQKMNIRGRVEKKQRRNEEEKKEEEEEENEEDGNEEDGNSKDDRELSKVAYLIFGALKQSEDGNSKDDEESVQSRFLGALNLGHLCTPGNPSLLNSCSHCLPVYPATYWPTKNAYACGTCLVQGSFCWFLECPDQCCSMESTWKWDGIFGWNYCK